MRKAAFYRVINSELSADKFTADKQTRDKQTSKQADKQTSRQVYSRQANKGQADEGRADEGRADNAGADPCVRPPFCLCRIWLGRHTGLPLQQRLQLAHNTSRYIMKSSKCGENDMRLIATRKVFFIH